MKYLVMECHTSYAVLLDECGCFVKAANLCYQVGQTVEEPVLMREKTSVHKRTFSIAVSLAAAAACLLLVFMGYHRDYRVSHTSIYLTINPSVCMELNRRGGVIKVTGANEDGIHLLEGYTRRSSDRLTVTNELIERAIDMGYLSEGGQVVIDIDAPDEVHFKQYGVELRSDLTEYLESRLTVEIQIISHNEKEADPLPAEESDEPEKEALPLPKQPSDQTKPVLDNVVTDSDTNQASGVSPKDAAGGDGDYGTDSYRKDPDGDTDYEKDAGRDGDSDYGKNAGQSGNSDYEKDAGQSGGSDYGKNAGQGGNSDYEKDAGQGGNSDYEKDAGQSGNSDYGKSAGQDGSSDYEKSADGGESSDYEKDAGQDGSSDYKKDSGYGGSSDYEKD